MDEFVEFIWLWAVGMILMVTLPIWFIPYTVYKGWRYVQPKLRRTHEDRN